MVDTLTPARARTRKAILDAAVTTLAQNGAASLADIAAAADVGRTTLHRYFADRADLLRAIGEYFVESIEEATERARFDEGSTLDALDRYCFELFELGDLLTLVFNEYDVMTGASYDCETEADQALAVLIERGISAGEIDPRFDSAWIQTMLWSLIYAAWEYARTSGVARHSAIQTCLYTFRKTITAPAGADLGAS